MKNKYFLIKIIICIIIALLVVQSFKLQISLNELRKQKSELEKQVNETQYEVDRLKEQNKLADENSDEYCESVARNKLNYRGSDDIIYYNDTND